MSTRIPQGLPVTLNGLSIDIFRHERMGSLNYFNSNLGFYFFKDGLRVWTMHRDTGGYMYLGGDFLQRHELEVRMQELSASEISAPGR